MTETRLIALVLGVLLIALVVFYNLWRVRRLRGDASTDPVQQALSDPTPSARFEPQIGDLGQLEGGRESAVQGQLFAGFSATSPGAARPAQRRTDGISRSGEIVPEVDTIALIFLETDLAPEQLEPLYAALEPLRKAALAEGLVAGMWQHPDMPVRELRVAMQLADRKGPITDNDFAHFQQAVTRFSDAVVGVVQFEEAADALARAAELDRQCAETDIEVAVNIVANDGAGVQRAAVVKSAKALNLTEAGDRFLALATDGRAVYELRLERAEPLGTVRVSLALDVPHVADAEGTWAEMIATARAVASHVDGRLVDDSNRPLNEAGLQSLARSIAANQDRMRAAGIEPGGTLAARLYS